MCACPQAYQGRSTLRKSSNKKSLRANPWTIAALPTQKQSAMTWTRRWAWHWLKTAGETIACAKQRFLLCTDRSPRRGATLLTVYVALVGLPRHNTGKRQNKKTMLKRMIDQSG